MWIEIVDYLIGFEHNERSCHVCGMWIEMLLLYKDARCDMGHATYVACGLKLVDRARRYAAAESCHVCGMWIEIV